MGLADLKPRDEDAQVRDIANLRRDVQQLGPSVARSFAPIIAGLKDTIIATIQESYTTTVDMLVLLAGKANTSHQHAASDITTGGTTGTGFTVGGNLGVNGTASTTGAFTSGGSVSATGNVSATAEVSGATGRFTGNLQGNALRATTAPTTNITGTRVAAWVQSSDGLLGTASSSERFKTNIRAARLDPAAVLKLQVVYYQYTAELEQRELDPNYRVATEVGVIAERLHEAGLWQFVIYEREPDGSLKVGDDGEPVCFGVRYELMALALIPVAQSQQKQITDLAADIADLTQQLEAINSSLGIR